MKLLYLFTAFFFCGYIAQAQSVAINTDGSTAHASSILDVKSSGKGVLLPRMTSAQRKAIANPEKGLLVFDSDKNTFLFFDGLQWRGLLPGNTGQVAPVDLGVATSANTSRFGYTVSIGGDWAAISSLHKEGEAIKSSGIVYLYKKMVNGNWVQQGKLTNPAKDGEGWFGYATDISGDHLVVSAPLNKDEEGVRSGRVYLYERKGNNWELAASFIRPGGTLGDYFGYDVAIDVTASGLVRAAAGAPGAAGLQGGAQGYVRLFKKPVGGSWQIDQDVSFINARVGDGAGYSVDLDEELLAVGAPFSGFWSGNTKLLSKSGSVYVFRLAANGLWNHEARWTYNVQDMHFGYSVSVSNGRVAIGAPYFGGNEKTVNGVFLYYRFNNQWVNAAVFNPYDLRSHPFARFGASVSLSGDNLLIGAPGGDTPLIGYADYNHYGTRPGLALLYQLHSFNNGAAMELTRRGTFQSNVEGNHNFYGQSVGLSGSNYIISDHTRSNTLYQMAGSVQFGSVE